jgi:hypothetical protein
LINVHTGMSKSLKLKMVDEYLVNYKKKWLFRPQIFPLALIFLKVLLVFQWILKMLLL